MSVEAVLNNQRGLIVAPAGCGKTHLITETLKVNTHKPYLVLTHTTAGVSALKQRLKRIGVPNTNFVITTIDGWARRISNMFPMSCNVVATPDNPRDFYPELRLNVEHYIKEGHIAELIKSSYSRLLIDEYQDCDCAQHKLICSLSEYLPTIIFGDPMQCIFNFGGPMPSWNRDVQSRFPIISELNTPWRWINAGTPNLGQWILNCRDLLMQGKPINLLSCPEYVKWHQLTDNFRSDSHNQINTQYQIRNNYDVGDSLLVIGNPYKANLRHNFASSTNGIDVVEPVELTDIISAASILDDTEGMILADNLLTIASTMMTGVSKSSLIKKIPSIITGRNRKPISLIESAVKEVVRNGDKNSIANLLSYLELSSSTKIFRKGAFSVLKDAVSLSISDSSKSIKQAAEIFRERRRHQGEHRIPLRAIGSTLLLKGLEADHVLILDAGEMNAYNLYVALSRGAKSINVYSSNSTTP